MRTKIFILALTVLFLSPVAYKAQSFNTGIAVGVSTTSVNISDIGNSLTSAVKGKGIIGFEAGFFGRLNIGIIFIKPMLMVSYQGGTVDFYNNDGTVVSSKFDYGKIEVPVLFGVKILGLLRVEAGPVYNWIYTTQYDFNNSVKVEQSGLGYRLGANVELGMINLGLAYQGLTNQSSGSSSATFSTPNELIFTIALCFGGESKSK